MRKIEITLRAVGGEEVPVAAARWHATRIHRSRIKHTGSVGGMKREVPGVRGQCCANSGCVKRLQVAETR